MSGSMTGWVIFGVVVIFMLALDLGVLNRKSHTISLREALIWSGIWIGISLLFNVWVYWYMGATPAIEFFTAYLLEKSLSVDNIFVFIMIFSYFSVDPKYQHRILFWGILGALIMRGIMIAAGVALIHQFHWIIYIFGLFLIFTGIKMAMAKDDDGGSPENNPVLKLIQRQKIVPVINVYSNGKFFVKEGGRWMITSLFVVLLIVETTDVVFAVDSIPAVLSITDNPFIVFSSNIFAILGLRALYFAVAGIMKLFHYLHYGLAVILSFVGIKMLISDLVKIPITYALGVIAVTLTVSILCSILFPKKDTEAAPGA